MAAKIGVGIVTTAGREDYLDKTVKSLLKSYPEGVGVTIFKDLEKGLTPNHIASCKELGLEAEELARLKHITGFSKLFADTEYGKAWETDKQLKYKKEYRESIKDEPKDESKDESK